MNLTQNLETQSRLHLATLRALRAETKPDVKKEISSTAYAEAISRAGLVEEDPPTWMILAAAEAVQEAVFETTGSDTAEFDILSLSAAVGCSRHVAILVARLCGASLFEAGKKVSWQNASSAPKVAFEATLLNDYLANLDW
ncbi:MAG: hypothetical protein ABJJ69_17325 [Paracoccaceae bacterium]